MDYSAGMHTVEELQEMMELRKQMEQLQARYEVILKRPLEAPAASPSVPVTPPPAASVPAAAPAPAPKVPEPPPAAAPAPPPPVTPPPAPVKSEAVAPTPLAPPAPAKPVEPEKPAAAPAPVAPAAPPAPAAPAVEPIPAPKSPEPAPAAAPATPPAAASKGGSLKDSIAAVIQAAGKPLAFDAIYAGLEAGGYKLPENKPKLVVRKTLFNKAAFKMVGKDKLGQGKYEVA